MKNDINDSEKRSYRQILKSTAIMGGSQAITILLRIIRTKILAILIGPSGVGIIGIYDSITSLTGTIAGMGIETSGVRQIAEASGTGDNERISRTVISIRRTALISGSIGLCLLLFLSLPISNLTFGNTEHAHDLAFLSITIFFAAVTGGQTALIQGMRRIKDLAMLSIWGAFWGMVFSIPIVYFFGAKGIVFFLIIVSAMSILTSWWYSRKIQVQHLKMNWKETIYEAKPLLRLGMVFMSTSLLGFGSLYIIRVMVIRNLGLNAAGMYQAATTLSALYVGFILDAMGRDFYPRLTAISEDSNAFISLVNKQIEIGVLIAIPGVLATISLSQILIKVFYSADFLPAYDVLRWQMLGDVLRIVIFPMGFMVLAKSHGRIFFWSELISRIFSIFFMWIGIRYFGLTGTGMAFFAVYVFSALLTYQIVRLKYKFILSPVSFHLILIIGITTGLIFIVPYFLSKKWSLIVDIALTILVTIYSIRKLYIIFGPKVFYDFFSKIKTFIGIKEK